MLIDTHAHLCYPDFVEDLPQVIERAGAAGVEKIVSIATDLDAARRTLDIAGKFDGVYAAVGLHPGEVPNVGLCDMKELRQLASESKVVAIGETGLDYYREAKDDATLRQQQKDLFWAHLELAKERRLPVVIHNRAAEADILEILRAHAESSAEGMASVGRDALFFGGNEKFAFDCIEIGLFISYTGILTFKNAVALRDVAKKVSLDHVMLETDAPYLAPEPHRGKRNEPAYVPLIAEVLAQIKDAPLDEVARATTANAKRLFHFAQNKIELAELFLLTPAHRGRTAFLLGMAFPPSNRAKVSLLPHCAGIVLFPDFGYSLIRKIGETVRQPLHAARFQFSHHA